MDFSFYGTLMDEDVRATVLGRALPAAKLMPATLVGYRRVCLTGTPYPVLVPGAEGDLVEGLLARGLSTNDSARLVRYEGDAYVVKVLAVEAGATERVKARVFLPRGNVRVTDETWTLSEWRRERGAATVRAKIG